jgi:hypothetical protein
MQVFSQQKLLDFLATYHKGTGSPTKSLTDEENKTLRKVLKWLKHYDEYYTIVNLKENKITWTYGIENYLGYNTEIIQKEGVLFFRDIIHPFLREWHNLFTYAALYMFRAKALGKIQIRKSRYIINIPVKKKNDNYVFVKQMLLPFQEDENGNIISYLNVYSIVDEYRGQPLRPRFFEKLTRKEKWESDIKKYAATIVSVDENESFTDTEFRFINNFLFLAQSKESRLDNIDWKKEVSKMMGDIKQVTVRSHIRNIKKKIAELFLRPFLNTPESATSSNYIQCLTHLQSFETSIIFLQKSGILSVLKSCYELRKGKINGIKNF